MTQRARLRPRIAAAVLLSVALAAPGAALAGAGDLVVTVGWVRIYPRSSSGPLTLRQIGSMEVDQPQAGTSVESLPANTLTLTLEWPLTEHLGAELVAGYPPTHLLRASGTIESAGVLGEGQQWSPAFLLKYHFGGSGANLRPYVGAGVDYTFFRKTKVTNDAFRQASYGPDSTTRVSVNPSWNPLVTAGLDWKLEGRWSVGASLTYAPLRARISTVADNTAIGVPLRVTTDIRNHTVVGGVYVGYRFGSP